MRYYFEYETPVDMINISETDGKIDRVDFGELTVTPDVQKTETPVIKNAYNELTEYFKGKRKLFDIPLSLVGTEFQLSVWRALTQIQYGQTRSYKDVAEMVGVPQGYRAVGFANNKNPISIFIPCHRVIGVNGKLVGYAGGINIKKYLLELEQKYQG